MNETDKDTEGQKRKTSKLAIAALALGVVTWGISFILILTASPELVGLLLLLASFFCALLSLLLSILALSVAEQGYTMLYGKSQIIQK